MQITQQGHQAHPIYVMPPRQSTKNRTYKFLRVLLIALGAMVVLNLNIFSNRLFNMGQLFSPFIFLICFLALIYSRVGRVHGMPLAARFFGGSIFFFVLAAVLSGLANGINSPVELAGQIARDVASPIVFFATVLIAGSMKKIAGEKAESQILTILFLLSLIGVCSVFLSLVFPQWHFFIRGDKTNLHVRFAGVYGNPNPASMQSLSFMVIGLAKTAHSKNLRFLFASLIVGAAAILLTGSRAGILGTVFIVLPLGSLVFGAKQVIKTMIAGIAVLAVGIGIYFALQSQTNSSLAGQAKRASMLLNMAEEGFNDDTTGGRTTLATIAFKMWKESPIIGHGIGSARTMLPYIDLGPHNYYLTILVESGLFGFLPFFACWCFVGLKSFDRTNPNWLRILIIGVFLTISFYAMTSHTVFNQRNQVFLIGAAMGLAVAVNPRRK